MPPDELQHVDAVHVGHVEVEDDERHRSERDLLDRFEPVAGLDELGVLERTQRGAHHLADGSRVVDDQDLRHVRY
jgi:hypothetical protein